VLSTEGIPELGGNNLNKPIEDDMLAEIKRKFGDEPTRTSAPLLF